MKAIMISIKPKWVEKILDGKKIIELRKKFPKDYRGWVYIYCTKEDSLCCIKRIDRDRYICGKDFDLRDFPHLSSGYEGKGKVVARFYCDNVEDILGGWEEVADFYFFTDTLCQEELEEKAQLTYDKLCNYVSDDSSHDVFGYAIHITKLEIFDKPKEISEFKHWVSWKVPFEIKTVNVGALRSLTKAPQNFCYLEV